MLFFQLNSYAPILAIWPEVIGSRSQIISANRASAVPIFKSDINAAPVLQLVVRAYMLQPVTQKVNMAEVMFIKPSKKSTAPGRKLRSMRIE